MSYRSGIDCPHCGGSGQLVTHETACTKRYQLIGSGCWCEFKTRPHDCQFCNGTGREEQEPER
jgi:hypothetical protein